MKTLMTLVVVFFSLSLYSQQDMEKYLNDSRELVKEKKYKEALERFIWFHDHALDYNKGMAGVRLSFALVDWKSLGEVYPPAMTALIEIRDKKTKQILNNEQPSKLFPDVMAINRILGENSKTIELFQNLTQTRPDTAKKCWYYAKDPLFDAKRYDIISKYISSPLQEFSIVKNSYDRNVKLYNNEKIGRERLKSYNETRFVQQCIQLIQLSLSNNDTNSAREIHQKATLIIENDLLRKALSAELNKQSGDTFISLYKKKELDAIVKEGYGKK
jgi:hypothetical protein